MLPDQFQWKFVQKKLNSENFETNPQLPVTLDSPVEIGDLIIVGISAPSDVGLTVVDNQNNSYVEFAGPLLFYTTASQNGILSLMVSHPNLASLTVSVLHYTYPRGSTLTAKEGSELKAGSVSANIAMSPLTVTPFDLALMAVDISGSPGLSVPGDGWTMRENFADKDGNAGISIQDQLNPTTSPITTLMTLNNVSYWTAVTGSITAGVPTYVLEGPKTIPVGTPAKFDIVPLNPITDSIVISDNNFGGSMSPSGVTINITGVQPYNYTLVSTDKRALQVPNQTNRIAAVLFEWQNFKIDINLNDNQLHDVSLYFVDFDNSGRTEQIQIKDSNNNLIDTQTITNFSNGIYLRWTLSGDININLTGLNAVINGIFIDSPTNSSNSFIKSDSTTQGNWMGVYGSEGYYLVGGPYNLLTSISFNNSADLQSFYYTPQAAGQITLNLESQNKNSIGGSPWKLGAYVDFKVSCQAGELINTPVPISITPIGVTNDTVTVDDGNSGGTFSSSTLEWNNSNSEQVVNYTATQLGQITINFKSANGAIIDSITISVTAVVVAAYVATEGLLYFQCNQSYGQANGNYPITTIQSVNSDPVIKCNNRQISIGPSTWTDVSKRCSWVAYLPLCGSITYGSMTACGQNYSTASAAWDGTSGGGSKLTLGTPVIANGITSYSITNPGSGMEDGNHLWAVAGGTYVTQAVANVTVSNGSVTSVVPSCGSVYGMGAGYSGGNFTATYGNASITCNVNGYVQSVPIVESSGDFISLPNIIITGDGQGAIVAPIMSGPLPTDNLTYSWAYNGLTTSVGATLEAIDLPMENSVGKLEGPIGNSSGFIMKPTMQVGGELPGQNSWAQVGAEFPFKNKLLCGDGWKGANVVLDANLNPISGDPGGTITNNFYGSASGVLSNYNSGNWQIIYEDDGTDNTTFTLTGGGLTILGTPTKIITNNLVTITTPVSYNPGGNYYSLVLGLSITLPSDGLCHFKNLRVLAPNNVDTYDTLPYDADDNAVAALTASNGKAISSIRAMQWYLNWGGSSNYVLDSDAVKASLSTWSGAGKQTYIVPKSVRALNTNPSDTNYNYSSTKLYTPQQWVGNLQDENGFYLDMTASSNGANDNGLIMVGQNPQNAVALEFVFDSPHNLSTGQSVFGFATATPQTVNVSSVGDVVLYPSAFNLQAFVTSRTTFAVAYPVSGGTGTSIQRLTSTAEILTNGVEFQVSIIPQFPLPAEAFASLVSRFPNAAMWLNMSGIGSPDYFKALMQRVVPYLLKNNNSLNLELQNEHWNYAQPFITWCDWLQVQANFAKYAPIGTPCYGGYFSANGNSTDGPGANDNTFTLSAAHAFKICYDEAISLGMPASNIKFHYGSWWGSGGGTTQNIITVLKNINVPFDNVRQAVAPYQGSTNDPSIINAFQPAGAFGVTNPGNWDVGKINSLTRHSWFYNVDNYRIWRSHNAALPPGVRMVCYESGLDYPISTNVINWQNLSQDMMNHPSYANVLYSYWGFCQQGDPTVADSGAIQASYFMLWGDGIGQPLWKLASGFAVPNGPGLNNRFLTPQGGPGSDGSHPWGYAQFNEPVGTEALVKWLSQL